MVDLLCKAGVALEVTKYPPNFLNIGEVVPILRILLEAWSSPGGSTAVKATWSLLALASSKGSLEAVDLLLQYGARVNFYDPARADLSIPDGDIRPEYACTWHANFENRDLDYPSAMDISAQTPGQIGLVELLLSHGANPNSYPILRPRRRRFKAHPSECIERDEGPLTPLKYAVKNQNVQLVQLLLDSGADVDSGPASNDGDTPLQIAAGLGNGQIFRLLFKS
ncbi:ankyrin repeat-containing domain protein [Aspergillus pseudoustus]|uniref:Ankyrin repeat-containing domain protein n=1 Tax=Aspergillus pseudoustus TaxID=1810923 RepID=A0ABR4IJY0_9EURO